MDSIDIVRKSFGSVIRLKQSPKAADIQYLDEIFSQPQTTKAPVYIDLGALNAIDGHIYDYLLSQIKRLSVLGVPLTLVRENPDLRLALKNSDLERPVMVLDFLDEAVFPSESDVKTTTEIASQKQPSASVCPKCKKNIRPGAYRCIHCGIMIVQRRSPRHPVAIPFLYGRVHNKEFLNTTWMGGVTEDLDINSFSGVGFFSPQEIPRGVEIHLLFPTVQWNQTSDHSRLRIFVGRTKHTTQVDGWHRIGVALFDMFEYTGRFDIKMDGRDSEFRNGGMR